MRGLPLIAVYAVVVLAAVEPSAAGASALTVQTGLQARPGAGVESSYPVALVSGPPASRPDTVMAVVPHSFYFTRAVYSSGMRGWRGGRAWSTDYPKADRQFLVVLRRVTNLDAHGLENAIRLDDPALRRFPFLYAVEVGHMELTESEAEGLRAYLLAGGFLVVDDFWGSREWSAFERNIRRVLPGRPIVELPPDHPVFRSYYDIDEVVQVPAVSNILRAGRTWERDGYTPHVRGIFGEDGRLLVAINWNTDLGDAWEWADIPEYPLEYSTFAYQMGVNLIVYAMSH